MLLRPQAEFNWRKISKVHSNFAMTYRMVENLRTMHAELDSIEKCLEDEDNDEEESEFFNIF